MAITFATNINPDSNASRSLGSASAKWKVNGYLPEIIAATFTATANTTATFSNSSITADHVVINQNVTHSADISYTTTAGSITVTCASGIPAMTLYLGIKE